MKMISATQLKNNISYILNEIHYKRNVAIIERYGRPIAKIIPMDGEKTVSGLKKVLDESFGMIPDFPDVTKNRRSRKNAIRL